jgi:hypothetical protein
MAAKDRLAGYDAKRAATRAPASRGRGKRKPVLAGRANQDLG